MSRLHDLGLKHGTDKATYHGYCDFYQDHFPAEVGRLLEVGVMHGASLRMWWDFYPDAHIFGVENDQHRYETAQASGAGLIHADATDAEDVRTRIAPFGPFDVIIDDGSHLTQDQQDTFGLLWPSVTDRGVYVIEDLHTSYMSNYVNSPLTTLEWLAGLALDVTIWSRAQGEPRGFIFRHGFVPDTIEWSGPSPAESVTAIIRKGSR